MVPSKVCIWPYAAYYDAILGEDMVTIRFHENGKRKTENGKLNQRSMPEGAEVKGENGKVRGNEKITALA